MIRLIIRFNLIFGTITRLRCSVWSILRLLFLTVALERTSAPGIGLRGIIWLLFSKTTFQTTFRRHPTVTTTNQCFLITVMVMFLSGRLLSTPL